MGRESKLFLFMYAANESFNDAVSTCQTVRAPMRINFWDSDQRDTTAARQVTLKDGTLSEVIR